MLRTSSPRRIFLTGEPGSGKTIVVKKTAELLVARGFKVGGMMSKEMREKGSRKGFFIEDYMTHEEGVLAAVGFNEGPRVGKYTINLRDLSTIGAGAIQRSIDVADVILVDEIGPMELHSIPFIESVKAALSSQRHVLGTIHKRTKHPLVTAVKSTPQYTLIEVTLQNRDALPAEILRTISRRE